MIRLFLLLFFCVPCFGQRPIELVFDSIRTDDSDPALRRFTLCYHICNQTGKPVAFVLDTRSIIPVVSSSLAYSPHYKLFQNGKSVDVSGTFEYAQERRDEADPRPRFEQLQPADANALRKQRTEHLLQSVVRLEPYESKSYSIVLGWDRQRYQRQDENEYYLEPSSAFELQLSMHLLLDELAGRLDRQQFQALKSDPAMISGWYASNKLPIDLGQ